MYFVSDQLCDPAVQLGTKKRKRQMDCSFLLLMTRCSMSHCWCARSVLVLLPGYRAAHTASGKYQARRFASVPQS